jgi:lysyl-tRNA synthetase, class II
MNSTESLDKKQESQEHIEREDNKLVAVRREKLADIRQKNKVAFPNDFAQVDWMQSLQESFQAFSKEQLEAQGNKAQVAGRMMFNRGAFMVVQDMTGQIQLYINRQTLSAEKLAEIKTWDLGDIIGAKGVVHKSNKGDLYIDLEEVVLLTKSLRPLPEKFKGLY